MSRPVRPYRPGPLVIEAPTLREAAADLAYLARLWQEFTGRARPHPGAGAGVQR